MIYFTFCLICSLCVADFVPHLLNSWHFMLVSVSLSLYLVICPSVVFLYWLLQESLANARYRARQPCVYEDLFLLSQRCLAPPCWGTPCDINAIYTSLKTIFSGLQFRRWHCHSIFIRLAVIASETRQMSRNCKRIWPYSSSRSSKVIDLGVNGKPICDFLLVLLLIMLL